MFKDLNAQNINMVKLTLRIYKLKSLDSIYDCVRANKYSF